MFKKILDAFNIKKINEEHIQKMQAENRTRLEQIAEENSKKERESIKEYKQKTKESQMQLRRQFTTIEEYKKIAGNRCHLLDKLPQHERDVVAKRVIKLCKEDKKFRKDLMDWARQNYEIPKKKVAQKNNLNQNTITI